MFHSKCRETEKRLAGQIQDLEALKCDLERRIEQLSGEKSAAIEAHDAIQSDYLRVKELARTCCERISQSSEARDIAAFAHISKLAELFDISIPTPRVKFIVAERKTHEESVIPSLAKAPFEEVLDGVEISIDDSYLDYDEYEHVSSYVTCVINADLREDFQVEVRRIAEFLERQIARAERSRRNRRHTANRLIIKHVSSDHLHAKFRIQR